MIDRKTGRNKLTTQIKYKTYHTMTTQQTTTTKSHYGWNSSTIVEKGGFSFEITTMKRSNGKISSSAQKLLSAGNRDGCKIVSFTMFDNDPDHRIYLIEKSCIATEQNIKSLHGEALAKFEAYELKSIKPIEPGINTIFWLNGYGHYKNEVGNEYICYEVEKNKWGTYYKCVEPTELNFISIDHPRHESKMFGIGHYYCDDYNFVGSQDDLNNIIIEAHQATKIREAQKEEAAKIANEAARVKAEYLSQFQNADVRKTGTLLKNYAKTLGLTVISVRYDSFSMGNSYDIDYTGPAKNEAFEQYCNNLSYGRFDSMEDYSYSIDPEPSILENHILKTFKYVHINFKETIQEPKPETIQEETKETAEETKINLILSEYSEKAIVLRGDTKAIKDQLKEIGGSFNFKLKGGAGWIFSKKRESEIRKTFNI